MSYLNLVHLVPLFMSIAGPHIQNLKLMARDANPWHRASETKQGSIVRDIWHSSSCSSTKKGLLSEHTEGS
jgi:hypothetical protein